MSLQELAPALRQALLALGVLFVIVNLRVGWQIVSWWRRRARAIVVWPSPKPPFYAINLAIGVLLGVLLFLNAYFLRPTVSLFDIGMMFVYYGYLLPLSTRIKRGLYEEHTEGQQDLPHRPGELPDGHLVFPLASRAERVSSSRDSVGSKQCRQRAS